jgi:hypothetical protein
MPWSMVSGLLVSTWVIVMMVVAVGRLGGERDHTMSRQMAQQLIAQRAAYDAQL